MRLRNALLAAAAVALLSAPALAETIVITHAHIVTEGSAGEIKDGTVLIENGRVKALGAGISAPSGARLIDAGGHLVTPGLVAADTSLGAGEVEGEASSDDFAGATDQLSAAFDLSLGLNPASMLIPIARMGGVTTAIVTPELAGRGDKKGDKLFIGQVAVMDMSGSAQSLTLRHAALSVDIGSEAAGRLGGSHASALQLLDADLDEAVSYAANKNGYEHGAHRPYRQSIEDLEALLPVIEGKEPLLVGVHRAADIRQIIALGKRRKLKLILDGVEEGWMIAPEIAAAGTPVLLNPQFDLPQEFEQLNARMENAGLLYKAGVTIAIIPPHTGHYARQARYNAGYAVAHGLPWPAALAAITGNPAQIFGFAGKTGRLEVGSDADLVVWSGDPLEMLTLPDHVLVKGVEADLTSRAQALAKRYATLDANQPPAYRH